MTSLYEEITPPPVGDVPTRRITVTVNGQQRTVAVEPRLLLAHLIRYGLALTGTHTGCDTTNCGACTVLVDGEPVKSCTVLAVQADGREVMTVEGLAGAERAPSRCRRVSRMSTDLQCGFCTPGMLMASKALLERNPRSHRGRNPVGAVRQPVSLHGLPEHRERRSCGPAEKLRGTGHQLRRTSLMTLDEIKIGGLGASRKPRRRRPVHPRRRATTSTTSCCRACSTWRSSGARWPTPASSRSTRPRPWDMPGVRLVLTGEMMAARNLAWMPTLSYDTQAVLATDKVRFQGQEVACCHRRRPVHRQGRLRGDHGRLRTAPGHRQPRPGSRRGRTAHPGRQGEPDQTTWSSTGRSATRSGHRRGLRTGRPRLEIELHYPRSHPSPIETCGSIADFDRATSKLTVYMTTQAPHIIRAAVALVAELARAHDPDHLARHRRWLREQGARLPGVRGSILASILLERPVKWIEDKSGNLISTGFGRDVYLEGPELALRNDGKILGVRMHTVSDHGAFFSDAQPIQVQDRADALGLRLLRHPQRPPGGTAASTPTRLPVAWRIAARSGSPRPCSSRSGWSRLLPTISGWTRRSSAEGTSCATTTSHKRTAFGFLTDSGQYGEVPR